MTDHHEGFLPGMPLTDETLEGMPIRLTEEEILAEIRALSTDQIAALAKDLAQRVESGEIPRDGFVDDFKLLVGELQTRANAVEETR